MVNRTAHVFVLGDVNCSPRILSHAKNLAASGWSVTVSGYTSPNDELPTYKDLNFRRIPPCPDFQRFIFPKFCALLLKFIVLSVVFLWHVVRFCRSHVVLLQNPPAAPTFMILYFYIRLTGKKLVVDWHNYGYTLLELTGRRNNIVSKIYRSLELGFASHFLSHSEDVQHICVSKALQRDLQSWKVVSTVFYDRAPEHFRRSSPKVAHELFSRLRSEYNIFGDAAGSVRRTRFTEINVLPAKLGGSSPQWRTDRPALVVSSCSWTPDDDFGIILDALKQYDVQASRRDAGLPQMVFVVTGRGPLKSYYSKLIRSQHWNCVDILMPWLEWADYPLLLGCADLSISVHRSSSGLDLPMKVVDFMGTGVPVLALTYHTLHELLPEGQWGNHFHDSNDLANLLIKLLRTEGNREAGRLGSAQLDSYKQALEKHNKSAMGARPYWEQVVLPMFERTI